tara:strand:+ start:1371 stop:2039 length:669 start_codon:yes stop_codon:yes gene_type:complete
MGAEFIPLDGYEKLTDAEMLERSQEFYDSMKYRRTVRDYSDKLFPREIIDRCIRSAGTAPSGANMQPWHFAVMETGHVRTQLRRAVENEEKKFYESRASDEWLNALAPIGTNSNKPFLENAPYVIGVFVQNFGISSDGQKVKHYYATESVGIATGILITSLHYSGIATLTHTPSPMGFLNDIFQRPNNERPFLLLVVGCPSDKALVPKIDRRSLESISSTVI